MKVEHTIAQPDWDVYEISETGRKLEVNIIFNRADTIFQRADAGIKLPGATTRTYHKAYELLQLTADKTGIRILWKVETRVPEMRYWMKSPTGALSIVGSWDIFDEDIYGALAIKLVNPMGQIVDNHV